MVNCTTNIMEGCTYNLTSIANSDIILQPETWFANYNLAMSEVAIISFLTAFCLIIFLISRRVEINGVPTEESLAALFALFITSVGATLLFVIDTQIPGVKLIVWQELLLFWVGTVVALVFNYFNRKT